MHFKVVTSVKNPEKFDCVVLAVFGDKLGYSVSKLDQSLADELEKILTKSVLSIDVSGYEVLMPISFRFKPIVILVQFQAVDTATVKTLHGQLTNIIKHVKKTAINSILFGWSELKPPGIDRKQFYQLLTQFCEEVENSGDAAINKRARKNGLKNITFFDPVLDKKKPVKQHMKVGSAVAQGINFCKSLSNLPANQCTPAYLADQAVALSKDSPLETAVINETKIKKLGMNCILAVSRGSEQPASLIVIKYQGTKLDSLPVILIGKGVTFDSGGYSIKSAAGMHEMKFDMCGAASVMGTMLAISSLRTAVNVVAIIPCSENLINGRAYKPGDILTSMSGQTVEILSTDAEGRLLLADALTYSQRFNPALIIDVATLTGAAITALGHDISAVMSNNKKLSKLICKAGQMSQDHVWPLPLWEEYSDVLNSNFADMASSAGRSGNSGAGATVAACFLSKFVPSTPWAHLDVAGTAWHRGNDQSASGRPVALLSQFLINYCKKPF